MRLFMIFIMLLTSFSFAGEAAPDNGIDALMESRRAMSKRKIPWPVADDMTFMRRVWLDVAGISPPRWVRDQWFATPKPWDRDAIIEQALNTEYYTSRWTHYLETMFRTNTARGVSIRNSTHDALRQMVAEDRSWDAIVTELLTWEGETSGDGAVFNFWVSATGNPINRLDAMDDQMGFLSDKLLGVKMECVSCHDGVYHLEEVNKGLVQHTRQQFWEMAAFLADAGTYCEENCYARSGFPLTFNWEYRSLPNVGPTNAEHFTFTYAGDFNNGHYVARSEAGEGMRPSRDGGLIWPKYMFTGEEPDRRLPRRQEFARMLTADRQFARNMVNRMWKHFFGTAFVEPVNGWDLARLNATVASENEATVQPTDPEMLELVTDVFIASGFDMRVLIKEIVGSELYQLDLNALPDWGGAIDGPYFGGVNRYRRLEAESIVMSMDSITQKGYELIMFGYEELLNNLWDLPDLNEPQYHPEIPRMIEQLGGDTRRQADESVTTVERSNVLTLMNSRTLLNGRILNSPFLEEVTNMLKSTSEPENVVDYIYQNILYRAPTESELDLALAHIPTTYPTQAVVDLMWSCFLHEDFLFR